MDTTPVVVTVADGRIEEVIEIIKTLGRLIKLNSDVIEQVGLFSQSLAQHVVELHELVINNLTTMKGGFAQFNDELQLMELMQQSQLDLINSVMNLVYFNSGLGVFNSVLIFALAIFVIRRK